ncbi:TonB-dependent receptor [Niastella yeongjuensis]|uniref:TonB-dependent receptor n=1 Tax=Niastella yeongjuensis TaxID=354355 RepID=A0A1V9E464_9BACT|nr:TonB-dependent receptor [Niastella yeongjuensis]OQP40705.1 TonB-dependent receptor [Niastella yeongjuensis]SEP04112.1 iron complex outermembrane recepter protein [Niastella yeongjuensis]
MYKRLMVALILSSEVVSAQQAPANNNDSTPNHVFTLGEVVVTGERNKPINSTLSARTVQDFAKNDVSKALNLLPGVTLSSVGPRNEAMVFVRGFDLRQVPLLIDGIPVYVPYDGYVDLGRFTTFDLAEINVSKGYTSVLYGPNAMGGAINLISRRPVKQFELNGASGWLSGGYRTNINVGSNLGKFYLQAGASKMNRDSFPLSNNFTGVKTEEGGSRNNSYSSDEKYNIKVGFTPNSRSEYALSYIYQHGKKGSPVYAGNDTLNSLYKSPRYWQWPKWDKQSLYFISNTAIDSNQYVKTRLYYDVFNNDLKSFDDGSYTTISKPYAFTSIYRDYTFGGIGEYGISLFRGRDVVKATVQYKQDVHREHNEGEPERTMSDKTFTAGFENEYRLMPALTLLTGFSYNNRASIKAQNYNSTTKEITDYPANDNNAINVQGGLVYKLNAINSFNLSVARKTRFATTKDRYSYRLGTAIPNPDLQAEYSVNYELGYAGTFNNRLRVQAAAFYSKINNTILSVNNVYLDPVRNVWQSQLQNVGESEYLGAEAGAEYMILTSLKAGLNYTYVKRNNLSNAAVHFTDVPEHKVFGFLQYQLRNRFTIQANTEYNSERYSTTYGVKSGSFMLLNASATVNVWRYFSVEAGINNITDRNYTLVEGYPEAGRNYFVNLVYRL